jgi:surface antigen
LRTSFSVAVALRYALPAALGLIFLCRGLMAQDAVSDSNLATLPPAEQNAVDATLQEALERNRSGKSLIKGPTKNGYTFRITPRRTFRTVAGVFCREYVFLLKHKDRQTASSGIACRDNSGVWNSAR